MTKALDLFCGAGGASMGLHRAGFEVLGIDIKPQPHYPFRFVQADALAPPFDLAGFDFIWASPPCQAFTAYKRRPNHVGAHPDYIAPMRAILRASGVPFVIENVAGSPLNRPFVLCGSSFGLDVRRHRFFEPGFAMGLVPPCAHHAQLPRFKQATNRTNRRSTVEIGVWRIPLDVQRVAMGIDWMSREELSEAIPPAYSEYIGHQALKLITRQ